MKRRNFIKGLLSLAAVPTAGSLAAREQTPPLQRRQGFGKFAQAMQEPAQVFIPPEMLSIVKVRDVTVLQQLRRAEARMVACNVPPFPDGLYRGNIGLSTAQRLIDDPAFPLNVGTEFQFAGFNLRVSNDSFYGITVWGRV